MSRPCALRLALALGLLSAAAPARAAEPAGGLALTIYQGELARVREVRNFALPAGESRVRLGDLAAGLVPASMAARALDGGPFELLSQRFVPEGLTPQQLLAAAVGRRVLVRLTDGRLAEATLLAYREGPIVRLDGKIYLTPPGEIVLPEEAAAGLAAGPALEWRVKSPAAGARRLELTYLTGGLGWSADYVLTLPARGNQGELVTWATLQNDTGRAFEQAGLTLVAGEPNRAEGGGAPPQPMAMRQDAAAKAEGFERTALGPYHAYTLARPVDLPAGGQTQVPLRSPFQPAIDEQLSYDGARQSARAGGTPAAVSVSFSAPKLPDVPLPAGTARIYRPDAAGVLQFVGQDAVPPTPAGAALTLRLGAAFDVLGTRTLLRERQTEAGVEQTWKVSLTNARAEAAAVKVLEHAYGDWKILSASAEATRRSAQDFDFALAVPARGTASVTYTLAIKRR